MAHGEQQVAPAPDQPTGLFSDGHEVPFQYGPTGCEAFERFYTNATMRLHHPVDTATALAVRAALLADFHAIEGACPKRSGKPTQQLRDEVPPGQCRWLDETRGRETPVQVTSVADCDA